MHMSIYIYIYIHLHGCICIYLFIYIHIDVFFYIYIKIRCTLLILNWESMLLQHLPKKFYITVYICILLCCRDFVAWTL